MTLPVRLGVVLLLAASPAAALVGSEEAAQAAWTNAARRDLSAMCDLCRTLDPGLACERWGDPSPKPPFRWSEQAADAARFHAAHLRDGPCFQHDSCCELERTAGGEVRCKAPPCSACDFPTNCPGTDAAERYALLGYGAFSGENIAAGPRNALEATCGWLDSDGHRANILSTHLELGVGLVQAEASCLSTYWAQGFGSPRASEPAGYVTAAGVMAGGAFGATGANATAVAYVHDPAVDEAPVSVRAVVDGECVTLSARIGADGRALYATAFQAEPGCHEAWFVAVDSGDGRHTFPASGALSFAVGEVDCEAPLVRTPAACEGARGCDEEGAFRPCYPGPPHTEGVGVCHGGRETCTQGAFGACSLAQVPGVEICNGLDDDCDGTTDEQITDSGASCSTGRPGRCDAGTRICAGGGLACVSLDGPATEVCNGVDDDCDGEIDDGLGAILCGVGACQRVVDACAEGVEQACPDLQPAPAEVCGNGIDDDCDGSPDDGCACEPGSERSCYVGEPGTLGTGECAAGIQRCDSGFWSDCEGGQLPEVESCNGLDDDCNGVVDDGLGRASCGVGSCAATASLCAGGSVRSCEPNAADLEQCNGQDDDCDGLVDEDCRCVAGTQLECYSGDWDRVGIGVCRAGVRTCSPGGAGYGACEGEALPADEICGNALDDDCNGVTDDGCETVELPPVENTRGGCDCGSGQAAWWALLALALLRRPEEEL